MIFSINCYLSIYLKLKLFICHIVGLSIIFLEWTSTVMEDANNKPGTERPESRLLLWTHWNAYLLLNCPEIMKHILHNLQKWKEYMVGNWGLIIFTTMKYCSQHQSYQQLFFVEVHSPYPLIKLYAFKLDGSVYYLKLYLMELTIRNSVNQMLHLKLDEFVVWT